MWKQGACWCESLGKQILVSMEVMRGVAVFRAGQGKQRLCLQIWMHSLTFVTLSRIIQIADASLLWHMRTHTHTQALSGRETVWIWSTGTCNAIQCRDGSSVLSPYRPMMRRVLFITFHRAKGSDKAERQSGLSNVRCLHRVQMSPLEIPANNSSLELQNSSYNLVFISMSDLI